MTSTSVSRDAETGFYEDCCFTVCVVCSVLTMSLCQQTAGTQLHSGFAFWYMRRGKSGGAAKQEEGKEAGTYENSIKSISTIKTVEEFWGTYDYLVRPNDLPTTTDYHFFREGIKPTWEDSSNEKGGKWIVRLRKGLASRYWEEAILALIGGQFPGIQDGEICGVVVSIRYNEDILGVWNKNAANGDVTARLREAIKKVLQLPDHAPMVSVFANVLFFGVFPC